MVCIAGQCVFVRSRYVTRNKVDLISNHLYLPLSDNDLDVNMVLGVLTLKFGVAPIERVWGSVRFTAANVEIVSAD